MDPLYVLRDHAVNKKSIREEGDDIVFTNARFAKNTQTRFQNRITKEYFTLGVLYFAYQNADLSQGNYMAACTKAGSKYLSLMDNKDLQAFLKGTIETSASIDVSAFVPATPTVTAAPTPVLDEERDTKRQKTDKLQEIELDETLLEEKKLNAERLEAPKVLSTAFAGDSTASIDGISKDAIELIKLKRMKMKMSTITVEEEALSKKPVQKGNFVKADAVITKKIMDREKQLSSRSSILNTNGKRNFSDIIQAVNKSTKNDEAAKAKGKSQKPTSQTYDRYNVKEDQNWWADKLKTGGLDDFDLDTRGTFADHLPPSESVPPSSSSSSSSSSAPSASKPSSSRPTSKALIPVSSSSRSSSSKPHPSKSSIPSSLPGPPSSAIIIVPSALTSLLTMYNAQQFLEKGEFVNSMVKRGESAAKANYATIKHPLKTKGLPDTYHIIDNTTRMSSKDWSRVVAVFVLGQAWQFKDWQWSSPVELFSNVRGFYLRCDDTQAPPEVKSWNVKILTISKSKRHLDKTAVLEFWNNLEDFLARKVKH